MAKTKISEFSTTAGNNTDINSINIAEGCAPSGINDAIRELMRQLKEFQTGGAGDSVNSGGDFSVATNKFTVASASGNTAVAGTLAVTGATTLSSTLAVTGTTTLTGALVANGNATLGDGSGDTVTVKGTPTLEVNPTLSGGTANGVLYLNGSKVATSGSALTFDGSFFGVVASAGTRGIQVSSSSGSSPVLRMLSGDGYRLDISSAASSGGSIFNSVDGAPLVYQLSSSEQMRLTSTGLGIGTSSPGQKLAVVGDGNFFRSTATDTFIQASNSVATFNITQSANGSTYLYNYGAYNLYFGTGASTKMTLDSSGNLGIGTSSPAYKLDVQTSAGRFQVQNYGAGSVLLYSDGALAYNAATVGHQWQYAGTEQMRLDSSGNLGIGTSSPSDTLGYGKALDIQGTSGSALYARSATNPSTVYGVFSYDTNAVRVNIAAIGTNNYLRFLTAVGEAARIDSSGNFIHQVNGTAPSLSTNSTMSFELTSNTSLKIVVRGTDGTTRSATLVLV